MPTAVKKSTKKPIRFGKPSMTNLPYNLGVRIINTIINSPKPDFTEANKEIDALMKKIDEERGAENGYIVKEGVTT